MTLDLSIEEQAKSLAADNRQAEPAIQRIYWFPDAEQVRLIALLPNLPVSTDDAIHAFYFRPSPADRLSSPSAIALIRPEDFGKLKLPAGWGSWDDGVSV